MVREFYTNVKVKPRKSEFSLVPEGMDRNRADFEHILSIGWYSGKELERLNNTDFNDLHHTKWKS